MRLWKLKLHNYIGIYNGMGIHTISIDFAKCQSTITVIKGDNGSGKSTLFKSLNPFSDPQSYLIPGVHASKYIAYLLNDASVLHITYSYPVTERGDRKSTTCSIKLQDSNGIKELNPNLNINEGKEIICRMLDIDSGFMTLAQLSSDDRGLADKSPSERKKFINKKISELDAYNEIYKKLTKKTTELKAMVNSLANKIAAIGNIESIQLSLQAAEDELARLEENKLSMVADTTKYKTRYEDMIEKYNDPVKQHSMLTNQISQFKNHLISLNNFDRELANKKNEAIRLESMIESNEKEIENCKAKLNSLGEKKYKISCSIQEKQAKLDSIGNTEYIKDIQNRLNNLEEQRKLYLFTLKNLPKEVFSLTDTEYEIVCNAIESINTKRDYLKDTFSYDIINEGIEYLVNDGMLILHPIDDTYIDDLKDKIIRYDEQINTQNMLENQSKGYDQIPSNCPNKKSCPFIEFIVSARTKMKSDSEFQLIIRQKEDCEKELALTKERKKHYDELSKCIDAMRQISEIIRSHDALFKKFIVDQYDLKSVINNGITIYDKLFFEYKNSFSALKATENDIDKLNEKMNFISSDNSLREILISSIGELKSRSDEIGEEIESVSNKIQFLIGSIKDSRNLISAIESNVKAKEAYDELYSQLEEKNKELSDLDEAYNKAIRYEDKLKEFDKNIATLYERIREVKSRIEENKYKTILYNDYTNEHIKYTDEYNRYEMIRYYCSPTTGIQTIFMEMYMNSVIGISNQLLSMFFNGEYVLQPFVVNEKEFRMPVLGSGILNDDISSMSTSQICMISMILSFALLHQSSCLYNIIKIDELEGGLDTQNRLNFFNVLSSLMTQLQFDQCIMISHNAELNMKSMDVIILKNSDPDLMIEGNVIFDLSKELRR